MTREGAAAVTAANTGLLIFFSVLLFALMKDAGPAAPSPLPPTPAAAAENDPDAAPMIQAGWAVYTAERCSTCHSIDGRGSPRYPLDGVAARLDREQLRRWVVDPESMRPGIRKRPYDHLSDEELDGLLELLETLTRSP